MTTPIPSAASIVTPEVVSAVRAVIVARAAAQTMRERVDKIGLQMLELYPLRNQYSQARISHPKYAWMAYDKDPVNPSLSWTAWNAACKEEQAKQGLRPPELNPDHCPALVLESKQREVEHLLVELSGKPFGVTVDSLIGAPHGLERLREWIDLVCRLVTQHPTHAARFRLLVA